MSDFDVVVIGGGTAGMTAAKLCREAGARVCLVDRQRLGGDCLYTGCVPSKTLIASARVFHDVKHARSFGIEVTGASLNFPVVQQRVRDVIREIGQAETPEVFRDLGIEVIFGEAQFRSGHELEVGASRLTAEKFVIATGSRPAIPPIAGLQDAQALTSETVFGIEELPESLAIIGGGPIGCELAQAFARFGSRVIVMQRGPQILSREEPELAGSLTRLLEDEGIEFVFEAKATNVRRDDGRFVIGFKAASGARTVDASHLLVAAGRQPNVESLNLASAGVEATATGVITDQYLRTTAPNIWACGDVAGRYQFTHVAYEQASVVARNIRGRRSKWNDRVVPWTTFTDPELARVGLTEDAARQKYGNGIRVSVLPFGKIDRALCESQSEGAIKIITAPGWMRDAFGGEIVGAHILGQSAGEMLPEILVAMSSRLPAGLVARPIHVYPTLGIGIRQTIGQLFGGAA